MPYTPALWRRGETVHGEGTCDQLAHRTVPSRSTVLDWLPAFSFTLQTR
ncbi:MAG: hypothetical protein ACRC7D_02320 [Aeromonas popoffii]